jgi:hypothetical protein
MADVFKGLQALSQQDLTQLNACCDYNELPSISALMGGVAKSDGKSWEHPPRSLTIWFEGDQAKFCFGAGDEHPKLYGTFSGLSDGLLGIERALEKGQYSWKKPTTRNRAWRT